MEMTYLNMAYWSSRVIPNLTGWLLGLWHIAIRQLTAAFWVLP